MKTVPLVTSPTNVPPSVLSPKKKKAHKVTFSLIQPRLGDPTPSTKKSSIFAAVSSIFATVPSTSQTAGYLHSLHIVLIVFSVWSTPFRLSWPDSARTLMGIVDFLFALDILRNFSVGYVDEDGNEQMGRLSIARCYMRLDDLFDRRAKSSFWLDLLALVPFYVVHFLVQNGQIADHQLLAFAIALTPQIDRFVSLLSHFRQMELSVNSDVR